MKKSVAIGLVLLVSLFVLVVPALAANDLTYLTIINDTGDLVFFSATNEDGVIYNLRVPAGETKVFTVTRDDYDVSASACGAKAAGTINLNSQIRLRFVPCARTHTNFGEPTVEMVNLLVPPPLRWRFQFN